MGGGSRNACLARSPIPDRGLLPRPQPPDRPTGPSSARFQATTSDAKADVSEQWGFAAPRGRAGAAQGLSRHHRRRWHRFQPAGRLYYGAAGRQRRRQDHHHLHADGAGGADLGGGARARRRHGARAPQGAAPHELREPLRRRADAAHGAPEPRDLRPPLRRARPEGTHRRDGRRVQAVRAAGPALRQAVGRPADAREHRQGTAQRARAAAARRADRLARSRHGRLGALQDRDLLPRARGDRRAGLPQHGRGGAAGRPGDHAGEGPHHRRRDAGRADQALRALHSGGGVPRHRPSRTDGEDAQGASEGKS